MKTCKKCGGSNLYLDGKCKPCVSAKKQAYYIKNAENIKNKSAAWASNNQIKAKAKSAKYYAKNADYIKVKNAIYRKSNQEKLKLIDASYKNRNPEKIKASIALWKAANVESVRTYSRNRRACKLSSGGTLSKNLSEKLFKLQNGKCPCCHQPLGSSFHLDHIMPIALGGLNTDENMQLLLARCNLQKNAKHPVDFMQSRGFLV